MQLPPYVPDEDFEVFLNGVPQRRGKDYTGRGRARVFEGELKKEGRLGLWGWFLGAWGVGTYRQNDSVDVRYTVGGRPMLATYLDIIPPEGEAEDRS